MASNPMQRKSRNSFLLGMIITLLITGVVIVFLFLQLKKAKDEQKQEEAQKVNVYTLNMNVKSGQVLTEDMFSKQRVNKSTIPSNATSVASVIESWFLQTKDGNKVNTDSEGLYLNRADSIIEIAQENGEYYKLVNGQKEKVSLRTDPIQDDQGAFIVDTNNEDTITRVYQEDTTGQYYVYRLDSSTMNTGNNRTRVKEYLEINNVPVIAKVDMNKNTVITPDLVVQSDEVVTDDTRQQEYNVVILPTDLLTDDYIDIRLMTPSGQDFIVVSKVKVEIPKNADGTYVADTIKLNLREDETLAMSSAIVEASGLLGSKLYATKYVEAGMQQASLPTYTPNAAVTAQIQSNPNIVDQAKEELAARYSQAAKDSRNNYLQSLINQSEDYYDNQQDAMEDSITNSQAARQKYLETLSSGSK